MRLMKKLFAFLLVLTVAFTLVGCGGSSQLEKELADVKAALESAKQELADVQGQLNSTKKDFEDAKKDLEDAKKDLEAAKDVEKQIEKLKKEHNKVLLELLLAKDKLDAKLEIKNLSDFESKEEDGETVYQTETGVVFKPNFDATFKSKDAKEEDPAYDFAFDLDFDYVWLQTEDYNNGLAYNAETNELRFLLPGTYYLAFYSKTAPLTGKAYPVMDAVGGKIKEGLSIALAFEVEVGTQLQSSKAEGSLELKVGANDQLKLSRTDVTVKSYSSEFPLIASVDATGKVTGLTEGKTTIYAVISENGKDKTITLPVTVEKQQTGEFANGTFNLKGSSADQKAKVLAYMERYLVNSGASIPVYSNSGLVIYSERVNFFADNYIPIMGYGPTKAKMGINKDQVGAGTEADPAYRMYTTADPGTLNHLAYADSIESDFLTLLNGQLFAFTWTTDDKGRGNGWEILPQMASRLAYPVKLEGSNYVELAAADPTTQATLWKFDLRTDLKWETGEAITADDFIFTFKEALNGNNAYRRANLWHSGSMPIKGAKEYYDAKGALSWDTVGIKQVDEYSFVIEYKNLSNQWDVIYNGSGFMFTPVHKETYLRNPKAYGSSKENFVASGPYKLSYWEKGKEYRFAKNSNYFLWDLPESDLRKPVLENYSYSIVKDANAALALFEQGKLDVTAVPASAYERFQNHPNQKFAPGLTSFRLSVNRFTQGELDAKFGAGAWKAKPILQEDAFTWALYYGLDRPGVQKITKTATAWGSYFTNAYAIVSVTKDGIENKVFRDTPWGEKVYTGIEANDLDLAKDVEGYNKDLAALFYVSAVKSMLEKQGKTLNDYTEANPLKIEIEIAHFDGATPEAVFAHVVQQYNEIFNNTEELGKKVVFTAKSAPQPGMDVYYVKQMTGQFDLGFAGISGSTLDPIGFMEVFCDDNRSGLFLSLGFNSHDAKIKIDLDLDGDGINDGEKWWSFDALYSVMNGTTEVVNGKEKK